MPATLEDNPEDIIAKAMRGLGLSDIDVCEKTDILPKHFQALRDGFFDPKIAAKVASALDLDPAKLVALGEKKWFPKVPLLRCLHACTSAHGSMEVNAWLIWDNFANKAVLFDTGADAEKVTAFLTERKLELDAIMLTHTHPDHIAALERLCSGPRKPTLYTPAAEPLPNALPIEEGQKFRLGRLEIFPILTPGHSPGGTSYRIAGLMRPVLICGDALFAGSMGRTSREHYAATLTMLRKKVLSLPDETVLCPGHGPATTVAQELSHNPFF